ncbi:MAG: hypothetical protein HY718_11780, partial [Planctomycetes bacterium]|nr:hypothetical protein [Planctomycetota bacterium]
AVLVKDINPGAASSNPADFANFDGTLVFTADDGTHGRELWQSDGFADPNWVGMSYKWDLAGYIQNDSGNPLLVAVAGSNAAPLSVYWLHDFPNVGGHTGISEPGHQVNTYIELTDGTDRAPLTVTNMDCGDGNVTRPRAALTDGNDHNALAFGMVAILDQNPCDTDPRGGGSPGVPFGHVPAVYDGHDWIPMSLANFPAGVPTAPPTATVLGIDPPPWSGYMGTGLPPNLEPATTDPESTKRFTYARIDVWTDYMTVVWGVKQYDSIWVATLPRKYKGGFKALYAGNSACVQPAYLFYFDTVLLNGGRFSDTTEPYGACCAPGGCTEVTSADECSEGTFTPWTRCDSPGYLCCPIPWADTDNDGDVDSDDFAKLQRCYTGDQTGVASDCKCLDHNKDNKIDTTDVGLFAGCATGPGIVPDPVPPECGP